MRLVRRGMPALIALVLWFSAVAAGAQSVSNAQINGSVKDEGGLALPGVTVTVTQTETGLTRTAVTDGGGSYTLPNLPIGPYKLEAMLEGFRTYAQTGIVLQVNANPTLNVTLSLGQISETITVQGTAALVETRNPGIGQVVTNEQVVELPLNGRQLTQLILTAGLATSGSPGANVLASNTRNYPTISVTVAGGLGNGLTYILDGGTHNDPYNNLNLPLPFPDAMQEFKVETSALPAQYGHHSAAAINAVTKSGTNTVHGNAFEFLRDHRMNATSPFASIGPDGKRRDDGLHRDQFGGTLGGPIVRGKLFYFAGYQGTKVDVAPSSFFAFVPTPAMLTGDFSAITSPACNGGRTIALRAPFVNNTISPSLFSPAALNLVGRLPQTTDPCGRVSFSRRQQNTENLAITRIDYQMTDKHSIFGRYQLADYQAKSDADPKNVLAYATAPLDDTIQSLVVGDTYLLGSNAVSSFRFTFNDSDIRKPYDRFFDAQSLGVRNVANMMPGFLRLSVAGGFTLGPASASASDTPTRTFQLLEDFSIVKGNHQIGFGANYIRTAEHANSYINAAGNYAFTNQNTGLGLGDFLIGRPNTLQQGMRYFLNQTSDYIGIYLQDAWKVGARLTVNAGLRWDPYFPLEGSDGQFNHVSLEQFRSGVRSTVYRNAPAGVIFEGDQGYPGNAIGRKQWNDFAPRLSAAWDVAGNGRTTVRGAWGTFYDLPQLNEFIGFVLGPPRGSVLTVTGASFDDPYAGVVGGNPFPITASPTMTFPQFATWLTLPLDMKPPYSNQWNVSVQRQLGTSWVVSANYVNQRGFRLPIGDQLNPAVYSPTATTGNQNQRRVLFLENPQQGQYFGSVIGVSPTGKSQYDGLLLSLQRRAATGLTLSTNYTLSRCNSDLVNYEPAQAGIALTKPGDPSYNRGSCGASDRRHVGNISAVYQVPQIQNGVLGALTSDWQVSGIVRAQTGSYFSVITGADNALNGQANHRPNQVGDPYKKQGYQWLNPAAFQAPAPGTYSSMGFNTLVGPGRFNIDMGLTRSFRLGGMREVQFRAEVFNLLNTTQLGLPQTTMSSADFGFISTAEDPRIMQLALKFVF